MFLVARKDDALVFTPPVVFKTRSFSSHVVTLITLLYLKNSDSFICVTSVVYYF